MSGTSIDHVATIHRRTVVGQDLCDCCPVLSGEVRQDALIYAPCRITQPRRLRLQLFASGERGTEVRLVEQLAAIHKVAFEGSHNDLSPFGIESLLRRAVCRLGKDRSVCAESMHRLDIDPKALC